MTNETSIKEVLLILQMHYCYVSPDEVTVYEGDADYYIEVKIKDHYVGATLVEAFAEIGLHIHSFQSLNGKYGKLMQFCLSGDLKD